MAESTFGGEGIHLILLGAPQHAECLTSGGINVEILSIRITKP